MATMNSTRADAKCASCGHRRDEHELFACNGRTGDFGCSCDRHSFRFFTDDEISEIAREMSRRFERAAGG
jgi:hypothetical protein